MRSEAISSMPVQAIMNSTQIAGQCCPPFVTPSSAAPREPVSPPVHAATYEHELTPNGGRTGPSYPPIPGGCRAWQKVQLSTAANAPLFEPPSQGPNLRPALGHSILQAAQSICKHTESTEKETNADARGQHVLGTQETSCIKSLFVQSASELTKRDTRCITRQRRHS
eukprot:6208390-Pleurochrysis_carterae.AAC.3